LTTIPTRTGEPRIHQTARLRNSTLGRFTAIGERCAVLDSKIGDYSYIEHDSGVVYARLGKFCAVAAFVQINALNHPMDRISQHKITYRPNEYFLDKPLDDEFRSQRIAKGVTVGHDVWIGHGAIVLPAVTIGDGAVIAAGAVVTRPVEDYAIVAGVPAVKLRDRFPPPIQQRIQALAWWHWPHDRLADAVDDMRQLGVEAFLEKWSSEGVSSEW
jgi:phosphonate metabolism protein (transferase hexapeptide repeat family)